MNSTQPKHETGGIVKTLVDAPKSDKRGNAKPKNDRGNGPVATERQTHEPQKSIQKAVNPKIVNEKAPTDKQHPNERGNVQPVKNNEMVKNKQAPRPPPPPPPPVNQVKLNAPKPKASVAREPPKRVFRIAVRKLPVRDFGGENFLAALDNICSNPGSGLQREAFQFEHFVPGKIR